MQSLCLPTPVLLSFIGEQKTYLQWGMTLAQLAPPSKEQNIHYDDLAMTGHCSNGKSNTDRGHVHKMSALRGGPISA